MKKELRNKLLIRRKQIKYSNELINKIISNLKEVIKDKQNILIYYPIHNEINILGLIDDKKRYFLPYVLNSLDMEERLVDNINDLIKDKMNIPSSQNKEKFQIDAVIAPAIAMNKKGYRLGFGLGYYDRYLKNKDCLKIAVCLDEFLIDDIFQEPFDQKFDIIVTEKEILEVDKNV